MEHSIGTAMEFSTINRLLADFNINRESSVTQRRSPLKSLKITSDTLYDGNRSENDVERASSSLAGENHGMK